MKRCHSTTVSHLIKEFLMKVTRQMLDQQVATLFFSSNGCPVFTVSTSARVHSWTTLLETISSPDCCLTLRLIMFSYQKRCAALVQVSNGPACLQPLLMRSSWSHIALFSLKVWVIIDQRVVIIIDTSDPIKFCSVTVSTKALESSRGNWESNHGLWQ